MLNFFNAPDDIARTVTAIRSTPVDDLVGSHLDDLTQTLEGHDIATTLGLDRLQNRATQMAWDIDLFTPKAQTHDGVDALVRDVTATVESLRFADLTPRNRLHQLSDYLPESQQLSDYVPAAQQLDDYVPESQQLSDFVPPAQRLDDFVPAAQRLDDHVGEGQQLSDYVPAAQRLDDHVPAAQQLDDYVPQSQQLSDYVPESQSLDDYGSFNLFD